MQNYYTEVALNNRVLLEVIGLILVYISIPLYIIIHFITKLTAKKEQKPSMNLTQLTASLMPKQREYYYHNIHTDKRQNKPTYDSFKYAVEFGNFVCSFMGNHEVMIYEFEHGYVGVYFDYANDMTIDNICKAPNLTRQNVINILSNMLYQREVRKQIREKAYYDNQEQE